MFRLCLRQSKRRTFFQNRPDFQMQSRSIRVVTISDTHNSNIPFELFPEGDLLIHAGDHTLEGEAEQLQEAGKWLRTLAKKYKYGIVHVSGNHDIRLDREYWRKVHAEEPDQDLIKLFHDPENGIHWADHALVEIAGLRIFGTPYVSLTPSRKPMDPNDPKRYLGGIRTDEMQIPLFAEIPSNIDILITHSPPQGILDESFQYGGVVRETPVKIGSTPLLEWIERRHEAGDLPKLHVFGHEHDSRGVLTRYGTTFVNASSVDGDRGTKFYKIKEDLVPFTMDITPKEN